MTIEINKKRRPQLLAAVSQALLAVQVEHGSYVDVSSLAGFAEAEKKLSPDELAALTTILGERPLVTFAAGFLSERLEDRPLDKDNQEALVAVWGSANVSGMAEDLVAALERLPLHYDFSFALPFAINAALSDGGPWPIRPDFRVHKGEVFHTALPLHRPGLPDDDRFLIKFARIFGAPSPKTGHAHLTMRLAGYLQRFSSPAPTHEQAEQRIRSFFGLAIAFNVLQYRPPFGEAERVEIYVHTPTALGVGIPLLKFALSTSTSRTVQGLAFVNPSTTGSSPAPWPSYVDGSIEWIEWTLSHAKGERLVRAARWLFDSFGADSILMQYLQAMICLEILLGDEKPSRELTVGATLKNRCAYLIGTDLDERDKIISDLSRIYEVRSEIVHTGTGPTSSQDRSLLQTLRWYCIRVIHAEAKRLGTIVPQPPLDVLPGLANAQGAPTGAD